METWQLKKAKQDKTRENKKWPYINVRNWG
jgi:hypothetical protein